MLLQNDVSSHVNICNYQHQAIRRENYVTQKIGVIALMGIFLVIAFGSVVFAQQKEPVEIRFRYYAWPAHSQTAKKYVESLTLNMGGPQISLGWICWDNR